MALLDIDILARLTRPNGRQRVPVLGRRHDNPVHVLVFEGPAHVDDALRTAAADLFRFPGDLRAAMVVHLADVLEFRILESPEPMNAVQYDLQWVWTERGGLARTGWC